MKKEIKEIKEIKGKIVKRVKKSVVLTFWCLLVFTSVSTAGCGGNSSFRVNGDGEEDVDRRTFYSQSELVSVGNYGAQLQLELYSDGLQDKIRNRSEEIETTVSLKLIVNQPFHGLEVGRYELDPFNAKFIDNVSGSLHLKSFEVSGDYFSIRSAGNHNNNEPAYAILVENSDGHYDILGGFTIQINGKDLFVSFS